MDVDREPGQLVPYAPRSRRVLERTAKVLNLAVPPTGVAVAQPASGQIYQTVRTRVRRGKAESSSWALTDGLIFAGLGLLAIYEADKAISAWAGSVGADLAGLNPANWLSSGMNAQSAMADLKAAALRAAQEPTPVPSPKAPGSNGSNVEYVAGMRLNVGAWDAMWGQLWERMAHHQFDVPL